MSLSRPRAWLARWQGIFPLLVAELVVWLGFGALLPVMPLYFRDHGVDLPTMGLVIAAWPIARLVTEPVFGWLADRTRRVPLMLLSLVATGLFVLLPVWFVGPAAFMVLRALSGVAAAMYDPAARGYLVDATPVERRGEAFGLYGAAQMGGLLLGPAFGGIGAALFGGVEFVFVFCALATWAAAVAMWLWVKEIPSGRRGIHPPAAGYAGLPTDETVLAGASARALEDLDPSAVADAERRPRSLRNRLLIAALVIQMGSFYASGTYEVAWSLFMEAQGAGLDLIGLTFAMFGLPILLLSPIAGRIIDRRGTLPFVIVGGLSASLCGIAYTLVPEPIWVVPILLIESTGFAFLGPALFTVVAAGSPIGLSSTAQGLFGAAGTVGTIVAAVTAGVLAAIDLRLPFLVFSAVMTAMLGLGLLIGGREMARLAPARSVARSDARSDAPAGSEALADP